MYTYVEVSVRPFVDLDLKKGCRDDLIYIQVSYLIGDGNKDRAEE